MIGLISSTISPSELASHDGARTNLDPQTRLVQTIESVASLVKLGFTSIIVADNSANPLSEGDAALLAPATVMRFQHFPYRNKGIAEAFLLLAATQNLPANTPLMKLSGRYRASRNLAAQLETEDFIGRFGRSGRFEDVSTRAYATRDVDFFRRFISGALDEMYAAPWRVVGPRSLLALTRRVLRPKSDTYPYSDPKTSLELACARWLARTSSRIRRVEELGVEGVMGSWINPAVQE